MAIQYKANDAINKEEVIHVFKAVGWNKDPDNIVDAFNHSYYITARDQGNLVAFARAISDGYYYTGIYDVVVLPDYQKKGIGYHMVKMLMKEYEGQYFFLTYTKGNKAFYEKCGFKENNNAMWVNKE